MDVVPYQVRIRVPRPESEPTALESRGRPRPKLSCVRRRRKRLPLTLIAVAFGCLAFAATTQAGIDDSTANAEPPAVTPAVAVTAPPIAAADPVQAAMPNVGANEAEPLVSAQYQGEDGGTSVPVEPDTAPAQADDLSGVHRPAESSTPAQGNSPAPAADRLLVTHASSAPIEPASPGEGTQSAQPSLHSSAASTQRPAEKWYRPPNSQYQFDSQFRRHVSHSVTLISSAHTALHVLDQAATDTATRHLNLSASSVETSTDSLPTATSISAKNLSEVALCLAHASAAGVESALSGDHGSSCAKNSRRYHGAEPRYRAGSSEREAVSNVMGTLGAAAQRQALRGTAARPSPDPQPATGRVKNRPASSPAAASAPPFLPRAGAAATRALSLLAPSRPPELLALPPAARIAKRLGASLLPTLEAIPGPAGLQKRNLAGGRLADTRRLLQIGLALGLAYLVFLTLWFWGTRGRHRGLRGGARF